MAEQQNVASAARPLPTGTVAFLFTDIEGSTQRWETHRAAMADAIRRHDSLMHDAIAAHDGYVFKRMGDAFCAAFRTAPDAIAAGYAAQRALTQTDFSAVEGLKARMAIHVGQADEHNGDYFGPTVNRVARLLAIGYGGQLLVSGAAADLMQGEMPAQTALRDLGSHRLKDLAHPEQVYQLVAPDLPQKFFPLRSLDALPNNLPLQLTSFVGREDEIEGVKALVDLHRLTTLVGTGGVGKTRLALQAGADLLDRYEDGVWFVELAPLSDGTLILSELAPLFGVQATGDRPVLDALLAALRPKHALLIIDNCEHLVDPAADIIEKILRGCPNIRVLATSREALKIAGETVHRVASLHEDAAVALFAERATSASDSFQLTDDNRATVGKICRRLDGIALAIELAAARVRAVDVDELFARLDQRFRILTGGSRTALPRQQTMRALIDWSYDLLPAAEQVLLRRVSIFAGGWTLDAASAICTDDEVQAWDIVDQLTSLVDKSLVVAELSDASDGSSKLRYRLLESTRQYAAEKLAAGGDRDRLRRCHAEYFAALVHKAFGSWSTTPTRTWLASLEAEVDNFRAALDWALAEKQDPEIGGKLAGELFAFWRDRGMMAEGLRHIDAALTLEDSLTPPTVAQLWYGRSIAMTGVWTKMRDAAERARDAFAQLGDESGVMRSKITHGEALTRMLETDEALVELTQAWEYFKDAGEARWANYALSALSRNALWRGEVQLARDRAVQVLAEARQQGDDRLIGVMLNNLAEREFAIGNIDRAIELVREVISHDREHNDTFALSNNLANLAAYLIAKGDMDEAHRVAKEALRRARDAQNRNLIVCSIQHIATIAAARGAHETGALLLGFTDSWFSSSYRETTEQREYDGAIALLHSGLDEAQVTDLLQRGASMREEQAVADALRT
jgi:predicted ATPase/class 3 adenylate cyclase